MTDIFTKKKRSWIMSRIRGKHTKIERDLERELKGHKLRFRKHYKILGKPDFVFLDSKTAVFVDGCFWHACPKHFVKPATRSVFWSKKIGANIKRDRMVTHLLRKQGWRVIRVWEHDVERDPEKVAARIVKVLNRA